MSKPTHENIVEFKVYGADALFSDVLTRTGLEKYSYPIPTYEALTGNQRLFGILTLFES